MENGHEYEELAKGEMVLKSAEDYVTVPDGEMLKCHIGEVKTVEADNYDKTEKVKKLVIGFELDEDIDGKGQVYTGWYTPSLNPKSNLAKLVTAIYGKLPTQVDPKEFEGMPLRITLVNREREGVIRQYVDTYFKPLPEQKKVEKPLTLEEAVDTIEGGDTLAEVFDDALKSGKK